MTSEQLTENHLASLSPNLCENLQVLQSIYEECKDVVFRPFTIGGNIDAYLIYIEGLSGFEEMGGNVLFHLMQETTAQIQSLNELLRKKYPFLRSRK